MSAKVAVTLLSRSMSSESGFWAPLASPLQPTRWNPGPGVAVRVTVLP